MDRRIGQVRLMLRERGLDALIVSQPENRRYLSGFTGSAGVVVVTAEEALLLVDFRYTEQATRQSPHMEVQRVSGRLEEDLPPVLERLGGRRWAFESAHISVAQHERMRPVFEAAGVALEGVEGLVEGLRAVKDGEEIACLREAVRITDEAFAYLLDWVRPGVTEQEAAWEIEKYMREHGAEAIAFPTILAGGPNGALPHARAGERPLQRGEPIVVDTGAVSAGYCADMTRTICLGEPDGRFWEIYDLVRRAQERAEAGIRAGMPCAEADRLAREVIAEAGLGECFGHGLGHSVGLTVHEEPRLSAVSEDTLSAGVVVTVEPGIYIPGWGGVRIEDLVLVQEDGVEVLTGAGKDPVVEVAGGECDG